ncbi:hypothetical protein DOY81_005725 [Sarcophaga bullata]|nr:hypothetical protein DOY81_005725 [Sarcophaga bullata]
MPALMPNTWPTVHIIPAAAHPTLAPATLVHPAAIAALLKSPPSPPPFPTLQSKKKKKNENESEGLSYSNRAIILSSLLFL